VPERWVITRFHLLHTFATHIQWMESVKCPGKPEDPQLILYTLPPAIVSVRHTTSTAHCPQYTPAYAVYRWIKLPSYLSGPHIVSQGTQRVPATQSHRSQYRTHSNQGHRGTTGGTGCWCCLELVTSRALEGGLYPCVLIGPWGNGQVWLRHP
jgi:hypothetical protein